ncbi:hypothetical protein M0802_004416 [Mischocyttarus mexicanus]|nr:hypothetical protein M0802_004416 [Mischocyttarus mexicanus]
MKKHFGYTLVILLAIFLPALTLEFDFLSSPLWNLLSIEKFNERRPMLSEYDFIVIGAGSAGSVVANRLTENPNWKVLVLESGIEANIISEVPALAPAMYFTNSVYRYTAEPIRANRSDPGYCLSYKNKRCPLFVGNAIGGSSSVNFMIYARGTPNDFDKWAALGNPGWSSEEVLPYFKKSENCKVANADKRYHGYEGYLENNDVPSETPYKKTFLNAAVELGYNLIDYNSDKNIGFSQLQATLQNGRRMSAAKAFLKPIKKRPNLYIYKSCLVTRIVIDEKTKTAIGVEFIRNGKTCFVKAKKEVILSAGAFNSPKLLMLSGIGPKDHLNSLGIHTIEDLPVGYNLQDHVAITVMNFLLPQPSPSLFQISNFYNYIFKNSGPLTIPGSTEALGFISTKNDKDRKDPNLVERRDVEVILTTGTFIGEGADLFPKILQISDEFYNNVFAEYKNASGFTMAPVLLTPKSRGRVSLKSTDPSDSPAIETNYLDDEDDVNVLINAVKKVIELSSTEAFKKANITMVPLMFPECSHTEYMTDSFWRCFVHHVAGTLWHFAGTCTMSPKDKSGVVNHELKVHGIKSLRVVDNSIIPILSTGHLVTVAYMIGEKASDMIKQDWGYANNEI